MLTGLKVSSLVCKCVFYRAKQNAKWRLNFECLEMYFILKYFIPKSLKSRRKKWVIFLVIMFTPGALVIKMSKND